MLIETNKFWISSDFHFRHKNILKYDNRPFDSIEEHDEEIIKRHNKVVGEGDHFFFLGDFCFDRTPSTIHNLMPRLNGNKYFIKGNHDKEEIIKAYEAHGTYLGEQCMIKVGDNRKTAQDIVLNHFALRVWDKSHHGSWHLYGHSHGSIESIEYGKSMDIGIMINHYYPFSFYQIKAILDKRNIHSVDHHKPVV